MGGQCKKPPMSDVESLINGNHLQRFAVGDMDDHCSTQSKVGAFLQGVFGTIEVDEQFAAVIT